jgi:hypothetical protein
VKPAAWSSERISIASPVQFAKLKVARADAGGNAGL